MPCNITHKMEVLRAMNLGLSVTMDRYTRYYVNENWGGSSNRSSFSVQRGKGIGSFFRALPIS